MHYCRFRDFSAHVFMDIITTFYNIGRKRRKGRKHTPTQAKRNTEQGRWDRSEKSPFQYGKLQWFAVTRIHVDWQLDGETWMSLTSVPIQASVQSPSTPSWSCPSTKVNKKYNFLGPKCRSTAHSRSVQYTAGIRNNQILIFEPNQTKDKSDKIEF